MISPRIVDIPVFIPPAQQGFLNLDKMYTYEKKTLSPGVSSIHFSPYFLYGF